MGAVLTVSTVAQAAPATVNITVGSDQPLGGTLFEGMRFLAPGPLKVHKGDTLNFVFRGFHTATLIPDTTSAVDWRQDHQGPTGDYALVQPDSDDGAGQFAFNNADALQSDPQCGTATTPCAYDGKTVVNSGAFNNTFAVTVNDQPGSSFWVLCLIHGDMQIRVKVVPDSDPATTQNDINSYAASQLAADHEAALAAIPKLQHQTSHKAPSGTRVWDAYAGYDQDGWGLDGMFPSRLHIARGDRVRWHFTQLMGNIHTVTFPRSQAVALNGAFGSPVCEATGGDTPPSSPGPPFCTDPTALELHIPGAALFRSGSVGYNGTGLHTSGVEGPGAATERPFDLKFTHRSSRKGYRYSCIIHGGMMQGWVFVR